MNRPVHQPQRVSRWLSRRALPAVLALVLALVHAGCAGRAPAGADWERRVMKVLQARKAAARPGDDEPLIASTPAREYVSARTALLVSGDARFTIRSERDGATVQATVKAIWPSRSTAGPGAPDQGFSSAAALTWDGYFLTAAHCVEPPPVHLIIVDRAGRLRPVRVRIVWRGNVKAGGPDCALIHVPVSVAGRFPLLPPGEEPSPGEVWAGGFGLAKQAQVRGRLISAGPWRSAPDGCRWREVWHTAPLTSGDSGGPAVDPGGRLVGVHSIVEGQALRLFGLDWVLSYRAGVISPDPEWLQARIARDRARRRK